MCNCKAVKEEYKDKIIEIINSHKGEEGALMPVLQEVQGVYGYLPKEVQILIAEGLDISLAEVYGVVTFYAQFTTEPVGKYRVGICLGTACYVKGADKILDELKKELGINENETSEDNMFSLDATRCIGACGLAPVMSINGEVYGKLTTDQIKPILDKYRK
ncbi:MAG: NAD(P)H-dependent oxidoreductase subunit E [Clostridia bacterium]|jgi:NADH:ubiquinone oxidoreductase subunit E|nr:NAD(P)H-dependent oxidoreductase subunit E [Clostridia bacterium]